MTPTDWESPDWGTFEKVHGWRNYVSQEIQDMWPTFTAAQKQALARMFYDMAGDEPWD